MRNDFQQNLDEDWKALVREIAGLIENGITDVRIISKVTGATIEDIMAAQPDVHKLLYGY